MKEKVLVLILFCFFNCSNNDLNPLEVSLIKLEASMSKDDLKEFLKNSENSSKIHFKYGIHFRNENLRSPTDSTLVKYFNSLGVFHEDYMSEIAFKSLHRKLNNVPIDLEGQLNIIHSKLNETKLLDDLNLKRALKYYNKYQIGDTIIIRRQISGDNAVQKAYPEHSHWKHNDTLDLLIKGILFKKNTITDSSYIPFKLRILSSNHSNYQSLLNNTESINEVNGDFRLDIIEDFSSSKFVNLKYENNGNIVK